MIILINELFQDSDSGTITISATGIFGIVFGAAVAIGSLIFGIWWSKFRGTHIYPVNDNELQPLNQHDPDESDAPTQPPAEQSQPEESQGQPQSQSGEPQAQPQSQSRDPQGQSQSDAENPFELEGQF